MNRFSQKDTLRGSVTQPGSLNRYLYCQNDPVNFMDPSGMRQVAGMYGDGTGRTSTAKQTTPIVTKPSQNANASIPVKNRTAPVQMTDTGTGSYTSSNNAAKQVGNAVTNKAHTGYAGNTAETYGTSHNSGAFAESPSVSGVGNGRGFSCGRSIHALGAGDYEGIGKTIEIFVHPSILIKENEQIIRKIRENAIETKNGEREGTFTIGLSVSTGFGAGGGVNMGIGFDMNGNIGILSGYSYGAAMPSASVAITVSVSNATSFDALGGTSIVVGASGGEVVGGAEVVIFPDDREGSEESTFIAGTIMGGLGAGLPIELHGEAAHAETASFNIYDVVVALCDFILHE